MMDERELRQVLQSYDVDDQAVVLWYRVWPYIKPAVVAMGGMMFLWKCGVL